MLLITHAAAFIKHLGNHEQIKSQINIIIIIIIITNAVIG